MEQVTGTPILATLDLECGLLIVLLNFAKERKVFWVVLITFEPVIAKP